MTALKAYALICRIVAVAVLLLSFGVLIGVVLT